MSEQPTGEDPYARAIARLEDALERAAGTDTPEPTAMTLATTGTDGWPNVRTVLLKGLDERGAVFYTNRCSRKAQAIALDPRVALSFHWQALAEQVHVLGVAIPVAEHEADAYWASRPRASQIGAWASRQSETLDWPGTLEARVREFETRFPEEVPRPPHWSGYRVVPHSIEFWKAGDGRLHHRERYFFDVDGWHHTFLNP